MSSIGTQIEHALWRLPPLRRAELERLILQILAEFSIPKEEEEAYDQQRTASLWALAGSCPDFPDDIDEVGAWRVDPVSGERHLLPPCVFEELPIDSESLKSP